MSKYICKYYLTIFILSQLTFSINALIFDHDISLININEYYIGNNDPSGATVSVVSDINSDGYHDILFGSSGKAYLIFGEKNLSGSLNNKKVISFHGEQYTFLLCKGLDDVNGDGYDDFLLSCPQMDYLYSEVGKTYLFFGRSNDWDDNIDVINSNASFYGEEINDMSGQKMAGLGDINNDGFNDFAIGTAYNAHSGFNKGITYIIWGKKNGWENNISLSFSNTSFIGEFENDRSCFSISDCGDVNQDGYDDFLIGAVNSNEGRGKVYLIFGGKNHWTKNNSLANSNASFIGINAGESAGSSVAGLGDINGDGFNDFIIGATYSSDKGSRTGKVYLIFGKKNGWSNNVSLNEANASIIGEQPYCEFGIVSRAGDINNDGLNDIIISAPQYSEGDKYELGKTYVIYGMKKGWTKDMEISLCANASFVGENKYDHSGNFIDGGGDVNGDGFDDILIGTPEYGIYGDGKVYLIMYEPYENKPPNLLTRDRYFIDEDKTYFIKYDAIDNDPTTDVISWDIRTNANWLTINNDNASLLGIPCNEDVGSYWVNVTVKDDRQGYNWSNFTLTVNNTNDPPIFITENVTQVFEDTEYSVEYKAEDIDPVQDVLTWSLETDATWLSINKSNGILSGIPSNDHVGHWGVIIKVDDGNGGNDTMEFSVEVVNVNDDPIITTIPVIYAYEDAEYIQMMDCYDIDPTNDTLHVDVDTNALFLSQHPTFDWIVGTPRNEDIGSYWVNYTVSDDKGGSAFLNYTLTVLNTNDPPKIITPDVFSATEDVEYLVNYSAIDGDPTPDTFVWGLETNSSFLQIGAKSGQLRGIPSNDDVGIWWVNVSVSDGELKDWRNFTLHVLNVNDPPMARSEVYSITMDEDGVFDLKFNDVFIDNDGDKLTYTVETSNNLSLIVQNNYLQIIPYLNWAGVELVHVFARDKVNITEGTLQVTVRNINDEPYDLVVNYSRTYREGEKQIVSVSAKDPDLDYGDVLNYSWESNGTILGTNSRMDLKLPVGEYKIIVTVTDVEGENISKEFSIKVLPKENNPTMTVFILSIIFVVILVVIILFIIFFIIRRKNEQEQLISNEDRINIGLMVPNMENTIDHNIINNPESANESTPNISATEISNDAPSNQSKETFLEKNVISIDPKV